MSLQLFVIFHRKIYPEMYEELEENEMECFTFIAVNGATSEFYKDRTINEWELPIYNPEWQKKHWVNGGVNHHIVLNKLITAKYAGFVQYDMKFKKGSVRYIKSLLEPNKGISLKTISFRELITTTHDIDDISIYEDVITDIFGFNNLIKVYNKIVYITEIGNKFPLYHMCIMESETWYKLMPKILEFDEKAFKLIKEGDKWWRFPIVTERNLALFIGFLLSEMIDVSAYITHETLV